MNKKTTKKYKKITNHKKKKLVTVEYTQMLICQEWLRSGDQNQS